MVSGKSTKQHLHPLAAPLIAWFRQTARDLPWRRSYDPYQVWISEIMLQQTQMERGVDYFFRWIERFPNVAAVAGASEQELLKYWEGLGYYARARNLHKAAIRIEKDFAGSIPCDYEQLLSLPGIGPYTAAAIASIAGNRDLPVIDANVARIYARLFNIAEPIKEKRVQERIAAIAGDLLPSGKARLFNQALMDLGGLVCLPKNPRCEVCPIVFWCEAKKAGVVAERPVIAAGKKLQTIEKVAGIIFQKDLIYIQQRPPDDPWGGLWEFPGGNLDGNMPEQAVVHTIRSETGLAVRVQEPITTVIHHYTRFKIILHCFLCELVEEKGRKVKLRSAVDSRWIHPAEIDRYAFPAGPRKLLEYIKKRNPAILNW